MGENKAQKHKANGAAIAGSEAKVMLPSKLMPISTKATITTTTTTTAAQGETRSPGAVSAATSPVSLKPSSPTIAQTYMQPLSPTIITTPPPLLARKDDLISARGKGGALEKVSASSAAATLHKKDSGTYMTSSAAQNAAASSESVNGVQANHANGTTSGATAASRRASQSDAAGLISPAGRVLTRPLSTSKLSSTPLTAPHILPNQRYAGFNLAALGQLSPTASTMTMSRADALAHTGVSGSSHNSYFGTVSGASGARSFGESLALGGGGHSEGAVLPSGTRTMCGSDAISLLDLEDSDLVMIDSNGNSSNSGVTGTAIVGETIASASAIVSSNASGNQNYYGNHGGGGTLTSSASSALLEASATAGSSHYHPGGSVASSQLSPRSSLPSLTSQAKKDAIQRAAMIAAIQQNGGAKILTAHRVGRRQDRPNRGIRFGEFHRICEIEYGFKQGKPLIANGRTLINSTRVWRLDGDIKREEMLYLFSDVLVTGTEIATKTSFTAATLSSTKNAPDAIVDVQETPNEDTDVDNPYAGHLENQQISRLTQVQADVVEGDERPLVKLTAPQVSSLLLFKSTACRDSFLTLLSETIVAHKHHLLFQSKYLADLKKFKRHSAFSFDTSFLKTWGIPGGLNLGSIRPTGGNGSGGSGHGAIGPGTFTASPVTSPGGSAFDPYQYQQHLNRPQSMAGSLFNFALNGGGAFSSFTSSADQHSKESSYATLRGANAAQALQYHHHQQQMLQQQLQNRLSVSSTASISGGKAGASDRTSSGSAFDALWFMKGGETFRQPRRTAAEAVSAPSKEDEEMTNDEDPAGNLTTAGSAASSIHSSSSATNLTSVSSNPTNGQSSNRFSTSSFSLLPSSASASQQNIGTLRNGAGWVRDEDASVCMVCSTTKFGVLVRKHHCRLCGRVICWKCCQMKDAVVLNAAHDPMDTASQAQEQQLRRPIRVCLDCIEQDAEQDSAQQQQPNSPQSTTFPLQGVFGKLMSSTVSVPHLVTSPTNATGSTFTLSQTHAHAHPQIPFPISQPPTLHPRGMSYTRGGNAYPHHHRASLYRIDVERVGEEDEEEEEEEEETEAQQETSMEEHGDDAAPSSSSSEVIGESVENGKDEALHQQDLMSMADSPLSSTSSLSKIIKSNHGTLRLKDLDPSDINEDEVNSQILTLESEVESLLIQSAAAASASPLLFTGTNGSSHSNASAGRTRVMRGIPKELLQAGVYFGNEEHEEEEDEEEKTVEELLAQQETLHRMLS
ncbi:hypothetical protein BGZ72_005592 [Mortierella alpina]|nr:hypothetical protein BGZ72_005592 [Mortierella alpina]